MNNCDDAVFTKLRSAKRAGDGSCFVVLSAAAPSLKDLCC